MKLDRQQPIRTRLVLLVFGVLVLAFLAVPVQALAVDYFPVVPCGSTGQEPCTPCHLFQTLKNIVDLILYGITGPIAAFMVVVAGGMMLVSGGSPGRFDRGKKLLQNTLIGVAIILVSWAATTFLVKSLGGGGDNDRWYEFSCPEFLSSVQQEGLETAPEPYTGPRQEDRLRDVVAELPPDTSEAVLYASLANQNSVPARRTNSPALDSLINCVYSDPIISALTFPRPPSTGVEQTGNYTYDNSHEICNYTRGIPIEGRCSHSRYSCHYGGEEGQLGAEAIDFNALLRNVTLPDGRTVYAREDLLFCELYRVLVKEQKCGTFKFLNWEGSHTHISTNTCDKDGAGANLPSNGCRSFLVTPSPAP